MPADLQLQEWLELAEDLPHPRWDALTHWINSNHPPHARPDAWNRMLCRWLEQLDQALGGGFRLVETSGFLVFAPDVENIAGAMAAFAEHCRKELKRSLGPVAQFDLPGKEIVLCFTDDSSYYQYLSAYMSEGKHGGSGGIHIGCEYPHVALHAPVLESMQEILSHELTHAALRHCSMPQWLEEGLAQIFEHTTVGYGHLLPDRDLVQRHQRFWGRRGLRPFWTGTGFGEYGKVQPLCYQLAEVVVRVIVADARPRWFGLVKEPQDRFFRFLAEARRDDCGEAACRQHLGKTLDDLVEPFLGPATEHAPGGVWFDLDVHDAE